MPDRGLGGHAEHCTDCGLVRQAYNSCRNRHCPKCQGLARAQWLAERQAELLPVPYFHVVFTVPAQIAEIAFQNKAAVYAILFKAASASLEGGGGRSQASGRAEIGVIAVLHTWGQNLHHHPLVHCVVPGGGLSLEPAPAKAGTRDGSPAGRDFSCPYGFCRACSGGYSWSTCRTPSTGQLRFFSDLASLADPATFCAQLAGLKRIECRVGGALLPPPLTDPDVQFSRIRFLIVEFRSRWQTNEEAWLAAADGVSGFR